MGTDFPGKTAVLVAITLVPAILRWWWGRRLIANPDDPAVAERITAIARRTSLVSAGALALLIALSPSATLWSVPLLLLARLLAAYPSRRVLYEERWSLAGYIWFSLRLFLAAYGLWIAIVLLPVIVPLAGIRDYFAATALGIALLAWNAWSSEAALWLLRARPIDDPVLRARFESLAILAGLRHVRFARVDLRGGALANAAALPSVRNPAVVFTDPLLAQLGEAEAAAICAHELAHHEYYSRARVRRMRIVNAVFIASGAALAPLTRMMGTPDRGWLMALWYVTFIAMLAWRARDRQRNETSSDLRAVSLCGDAEALIRGLTRLYMLGRVPRRLDPQFERQATHPSLSRRIREIRRSAGLSAAALKEDAQFAARDGRTVVTFQADRLNWIEGEAASHTLSYAHLSEVRVSALHAGPPSLVVVERGGRRWTMTLESADVGRAQAVLDVVDGTIAEPAAVPRVRPAVSRVFATIAALLAIPIGHLTACVLALLVAVRPSPPLLGAGGLGLLAAGAMTIRDHGPLGTHAILALALAVAAGVLLLFAQASRNDAAAPRGWWPLSIVAAGAVLSIAAMALGGLDAVSIHQSARTVSAPLVLSMATAGACLFMRRRIALAGAAAAAIVAATVSVAASSWFLDRFGRDPLLVRGELMKSITVKIPVSTELRLPYYASTVRLSPRARAIAVGENEEESDDSDLPSVPIFHVGRRDRSLSPIAADDLRFVDEERVLLLVRLRDGLQLREVAIASASRVLWALDLPALAGPRLSLDPGNLSWHLLGWNRARDIVRLEGQVGDVSFREMRWPLGSAVQGYVSALAAVGDHVTAVESRYEIGLLGRAASATFSSLPIATPRMLASVRSIGPRGEQRVRSSRFGAQCVTEPISNNELACSVFDGTNTRVLTLTAFGEVKPAGMIPGRFFAREAVGRGWIVGWGERHSLAVRLPTREVVRIDGAGGDWIADVALDDWAFATTGYAERGSIVRVLSTDQP